MNFVLELERLGIHLTEEQEHKFDRYYEKLIEVNQVMNLTAITERSEVYRKHFLDSLEIMRAIPSDDTFSLCDVGSGAGFPSIPLSIVKNKIHTTIIDSLNKRISFLNQLIQDLKLENVNAIHIRAEEFSKTKREYFDIVTARAVARLNILVELCLPLTKVGGLFLAMKGSSGAEELKEARKAIQTLGGKIVNIISFCLPEEREQRQILVIQKIESTPKKYPRNFNQIKEKPL